MISILRIFISHGILIIARLVFRARFETHACLNVRQDKVKLFLAVDPDVKPGNEYVMLRRIFSTHV